MYLLGIDVGTTNWKVVAYRYDGTVAAKFSCPSITRWEGGGRAVYDPAELWEAVCRGIRSVLSEIGDPNQVVAVGIASMGESGILVDERGDPLYPAIAWFDPRTEAEGRFWEESFGRYEVYDITGFPPQYIAGINKLMWLRQHEPERFRRARRWLCMADYIAFKLTGQAAADLSLASRTMALDVRHRCWSERLLAAAGVDPSIMPQLVPSGTPLDTVSHRASAETFLSPKTLVVAGGHDHLCGSIAAGVIDPGSVLDSTGTAEALILVLDRPVLSRELCDAGFSLGVNTMRGRYYLLSAIPTAGGSVEWAKGLFAAGDASADLTYEEIIALAETSPPGCKGLYFLPHLRGTAAPPDATARGAWIGLRQHHQRADIIRSVFEGLAYEFRRIVYSMGSLTNQRSERLICIGGGAKNPLWLQLKADVTGQPLRVPDIEEATALGAAILAGIGCGVYRDEHHAQQNLNRPFREIAPQANRTVAYEKAYELYKEIYPALQQLNQAIGALFGE